MDKRKILLVEDDEFILELYTTKFSLEGFIVFQARDGMEGVDLFRKELPNLVLLDIKMPKMDGWDALREMKKINKDIPVIMFTNLGDKEDMEKMKENVVDDYLVKSFFTPEEVVTKVKKFLNK